VLSAIFLWFQSECSSGQKYSSFQPLQFGNPELTFNTPQLGVVSSQINNPRMIQFGLIIDD
jgi:hypothetical protein